MDYKSELFPKTVQTTEINFENNQNLRQMVSNIQCNVQALYPDANFTYIGVKNLLSEKAQQRIKTYFKIRKFKEIPEFVVVDIESIESVAAAQEAVVATGDCYIELRGETEVMLVAERFHIPMFQINPNTAKVKLISGNLPEKDPQEPALKYEELICLTDGCISSESEDISIAIDDDVKNAVTGMWS